MEEKWARIQNNDVPWPPGTRLRLHFNTIGSTWFTAAQIDYAERKLEEKKEFVMIRHSLPHKDGYVSTFFYEVEVRQAPAPESETQEAGVGVAVAWIAGIIVAAFFMWIALDYAEVKVNQAAGEAAEKIGQAEGAIKEVSKGVLAIAAVIALAIVYRWSQ